MSEIEKPKKLVLFDLLGTLIASHKWKPLIDELRQNGVDIGVCTSMDKLDDFERKHAVQQGFDFEKDVILVAADKDDPDYYRKTAAELGYEMDNIALIDDGKNPMFSEPEEKNPNIAAARGAGAKGIHVNSRAIDVASVREQLVKLCFLPQ